MPSEAPTSFADLLVRWRNEGNWTRREIAEAAGVSSQFVAYLETGARKPSDDTVERLITAMDLSARTAGLFRRVAAAERFTT